MIIKNISSYPSSPHLVGMNEQTETAFSSTSFKEVHLAFTLWNFSTQ